MLVNTYKEAHNQVFDSPETQAAIEQSLELLKGAKRIFFIGNGGSNAVCSHMMEDYAKMGRFQTHTFSDPAMLTCYANDYGYENAFKEWLAVYFEEGDLLVAISSSGNSMNIINAVDYAKSKSGKVIACSGFKPDNKLRSKGDVSFYVPAESYGIVECLHHTLLHIVLDEYVK